VIFAAIGGTSVAMFHRNSMDIRKAISFIIPNVLIGQVIGR
jgi:prolipoprotein diacylglyceryltransferase